MQAHTRHGSMQAQLQFQSQTFQYLDPHRPIQAHKSTMAISLAPQQSYAYLIPYTFLGPNRPPQAYKGPRPMMPLYQLQASLSTYTVRGPHCRPISVLDIVGAWAPQLFYMYMQVSLSPYTVLDPHRPPQAHTSPRPPQQMLLLLGLYKSLTYANTIALLCNYKSQTHIHVCLYKPLVNVKSSQQLQAYMYVWPLVVLGPCGHFLELQK